MQNHQPKHYAIQRPWDIPELAENVLNCLSNTRDLLHIRAISKFLKAMVDDTPSIQRLLWKRPTPVKIGEEPHTQKPMHIESALHVETVRAVFEAFHPIEWQFYDAIEAGGNAYDAFRARSKRHRKQWDLMIAPMEIDLFNFPETRPQPLVRIQGCENCFQLHAPFKSSGLHHALRGLQNHRMCGRCSGSELSFYFDHGGKGNADAILRPEMAEPRFRSYFRSILYRIVSLSRAVSQAYKVAKEHSLLEHYCTAPICTRLILTQSICFDTDPRERSMEAEIVILRNEDGIKVGQVLSALMKMCRLTYWFHVNEDALGTFGAKLLLFEESNPNFPMHFIGWLTDKSMN